MAYQQEATMSLQSSYSWRVDLSTPVYAPDPLQDMNRRQEDVHLVSQNKTYPIPYTPRFSMNPCTCGHRCRIIEARRLHHSSNQLTKAQTGCRASEVRGWRQRARAAPPLRTYLSPKTTGPLPSHRPSDYHISPTPRANWTIGGC